MSAEREPTSLAEARDRRAREVLERIMKNESLQEQLRGSMEEYKRGIRGVPLKQLQAEERARQAQERI